MRQHNQMVMFDGMWYVYAHYCDSRLIYIGKGFDGRGFELRKRTSRWRRLVDARPVTVRILGWLQTEREALGLECELIARLQPPANHYRNRNFAAALERYQPDTLIGRRLARTLAYATTQTTQYDELVKRNLERRAWHARNP